MSVSTDQEWTTECGIQPSQCCRRGGGRDRSAAGRLAAAAGPPVVAGHRRSFAGHRLRSANPLPAVGDGPGHGSQEREDDARVLRRAAPTARDGAVPPPRIDGSRGRTARSPRISAAAAPGGSARPPGEASRWRRPSAQLRPRPRPRTHQQPGAGPRGRSFQRTQAYSGGSERSRTEGGGGPATAARSCSAARLLIVGACLNKSALINSNASWLPDHRFHIAQLEAEVLPSTDCHFLPVLCDFQRRRMNTDTQEAGQKPECP
nr:zinc finger CCCH domain-containing protein 18-like [Anser cygnoides]